MLKGAGQDKADERPTFTIDQVFAVADAIQPHYRLLVLLGALMSLRFGEFAALRRRDVNPDGSELQVRRSQAELRRGRTVIKDPKSAAGKRSVAEPGPDGLVFIGPNGGRLRRRNFHRLWTKTLTDAGVTEQDVHLHDLHHTGNAFAVSSHGRQHQGTDGADGARQRK